MVELARGWRSRLRSLHERHPERLYVGGAVGAAVAIYVLYGLIYGVILSLLGWMWFIYSWSAWVFFPYLVYRCLNLDRQIQVLNDAQEQRVRVNYDGMLKAQADKAREQARAATLELRTNEAEKSAQASRALQRKLIARLSLTETSAAALAQVVAWSNERSESPRRASRHFAVIDDRDGRRARSMDSVRSGARSRGSSCAMDVSEEPAIAPPQSMAVEGVAAMHDVITSTRLTQARKDVLGGPWEHEPITHDDRQRLRARAPTWFERDNGDIASMAHAGKQWLDNWWTSTSLASESGSPPPTEPSDVPFSPAASSTMRTPDGIPFSPAPSSTVSPPPSSQANRAAYGYSARGRAYGYNRGRGNCNDVSRISR
jgi:hypothetical protein